MGSRVDVRGVISSLSHIYKLKNGQLFIFKISTSSATFPVVVQRPSQLVWHKSIKIGSVFSCSNLKHSKIYQGTQDEVAVLIAGSQTSIIEESTNDVEMFHNDDEPSNLISYKGAVTAAEPSLQLYELDGSCRLVLSALAAVCSCPQLRLGDQVVVHHGHWQAAERALYACGRSLVCVLDREPEPVAICRRSAVHTLHWFCLPPTAVWWYRRTAERIAAAAEGRVPVDGAKGVLHRLLQREQLPTAERSLTKEFLCRPHRCAVSHKFGAPFELTALSELVSAALLDSTPPERPDGRGWHHWVGGDQQWLTVAWLSSDSAGGLRATAGADCSLPLLLVPPAEGQTYPAGQSPPAGQPRSDGLVLIRGPRLVVERLGHDRPLIYLLCEERQLVSLGSGAAAAGQPPPPPPAPAGRLLVCHRSSARRPTASCDGGAFLLLHGLLEEAARRRPVVLRLTGAAAGRAARLTRGTTYLLHSEDRLWTGRELLNGQLQPWLAECPTLRAPDDLHFTAEPSPVAAVLSSDVLSVSQLAPGGSDDDLLSVRGVIRERRHARDRYAKASHQAAISLDTHRVVLLLSDPETPDELPLYVCEPSRWVSLLGLVPGAALTAHAVRWAGGGAHLVTTPLSELELTGWSAPPEHPGARRPRLHLPVHFLSAALSDPSVTRWLSCVTLADLCRVSVTAECALCGRQLTAGCCGFVGCHGRGRHVYSARARSVLDDGSAAVTAQLIGDSVRQLLGVTDAQWRALLTEAEQQGEIFYLQPRTKSGRVPAAAGLLPSVCLAETIRRPVICELKKFAGPPPAAAGSGPAREAVFCESVMEASPDVVVRLFPDPAAGAVS
ncbi:uncharacterized protein LOC122379406 isoform X2 [Amphibalanus amphitrite]|uniref:uncharacterized protein LOC122379406 isoform X2 n=2 Tax=Amphibalanus amphitrite TaxID=1232801 RepID=UPI001C9147BF|nr:uncharacterized protein LOC122379406 isoform X2 [Amphibalanus amphitrite]